MINKDLKDPLHEKKFLPRFAQTLSLTHWSPTSLGMADGPFIFKYIELSKEEKNRLPANSQMKAGIACGQAVQDVLADVLWKINFQRKILPSKNIKLTKDVAIQKAIEKFKEYQPNPNDEKDQNKKDHYLETIPQTVKQIFLALEKLIGDTNTAPTVTCEKCISMNNSDLMIPIVGRTDFEFNAFPDGIPSSGSFLVELKTVHDRFGKKKKDGSYTLIRAKLPSSPSDAHLQQCSFYSSVYDYKFPIYLLYACKDDYKIFDSSNCPGLTKEGLKKNFNKLVSVAKRRERMLLRYNDLTREEIIRNIVADVEPSFSHPYFWNVGPEFLKRAFALWNY